MPIDSNVIRPLNFICHNWGRLIFWLFLSWIYMGLEPNKALAKGGEDAEDVSISFTIPNIGTTEISALMKGETLYLPINELFTYLKIKNTNSPNQDSVTGFLVSSDSLFLISKSENVIRFQKRTFHLYPEDLIQTKSGLYLRSDYYGKIFGLFCDFSFRNLSVNLHTDQELPLVKELRLIQMRENLAALRGSPKVDTSIERIPRRKTAGGIIDWSFFGIKPISGPADVRAYLGLGALVLGGETNILLNYHNLEKFKEREQFYLWRYANNDNPGIKQVLLGKIPIQTISSIYGPIVGAQITNTPTTFRKAYDGYQYSGYTEPNWTIELYVNGELVNYKKADPSGFYTFNVPLVYGNSIVKLRFYGPNGEEKNKELNIDVPFNFLPVGQFEYKASAGYVEDTLHSKLGRFSGNYGISPGLTLGGGMEYITRVKPQAIPFINLSARLKPGLLLSLDYAQGVRTKAVLTYRLTSGLQVEGSYTHYIPGQTAININFLEDKRLSFSMPIRLGGLSVYSRLALEQFTLPNTYYDQGEWLVSIIGKRMSANITTYGLLFGHTDPYVYSNYSLTFRLPYGIAFTPQAQFEYRNHDFISARGDLEKRLFNHGFLNITYERNFQSYFNNAFFTLRYELGFGIFSSTGRRTNGVNNLEQSGSGSLILEKEKPIFFTNRSQVGRGGIRLVTFLDLNGNGKHDPEEPKIGGLVTRILSGQTVYDPKDTSLIIYQLEPYQKYTIDLNSDKFENIDWVLPYHNISVYVEPNLLRLVELPVSVKSEAGGRVLTWVNGVLKGEGRILVCYFNSKNQIIARALTEGDGNYTFFGLKPGRYTVGLDPEQAKKLKMRSKPSYIPFTIYPKKEGTYIDSLNLVLLNPEIPKNTSKNIWFKPDSSLLPLNQYITEHKSPWSSHSKKGYHPSHLYGKGDNHIALQMVCFGTLNHALTEQNKLGKILNKLVLVVKEGDYFKLRVLGINGEKEIPQVRSQLNALGYYSILLFLP